MWPQLKLLETGHSAWASTEPSKDSPLEHWDLPPPPPVKRVKIQASWPRLELERDTDPGAKLRVETMVEPIERWSIPPLPNVLGHPSQPGGLKEDAGTEFMGSSRLKHPGHLP